MRLLVLAALLSSAGAISQPLPDPVYTSYDVFVVAGQSNARGRGDSLLSPVVPPGAGFEALHTRALVPLADPVGGANTGSAWPAFANAYAAATGRGVVIIGMAVGGSFQVWLPGDSPAQTWDVRQSDNLYVRSLPQIQRALAALADRVINYRMTGWLWIQGGADAGRIDEGRLTAEDYGDGLKELTAAIAADFNVPTYLFMTGTDARGDTPGAAAVRRVQELADALDEVVVVYRDAVTFPQKGWMQPDHIHWSQAGLNEAGTVGARAVAEHQRSLPPISVRLPPSVPLPAPPRPMEESPLHGGRSFPGEAGEIPRSPQAAPRPMRLYPNPASGVVWIDLACAYRYEVVDLLGRRAARGEGEGPTALPALAAGSYIVRAAPRENESACSGQRTLTVLR